MNLKLCKFPRVQLTRFRLVQRQAATVTAHTCAQSWHSPFKSSTGINGTALSWFTSYLNNRSQRVSQIGITSTSFKLPYGVPEGSCLGPLLFTIYSNKLFEVIKYHLPEAHAYADDTQLYLSFSSDTATNKTDAVIAMERCISDIRTWMRADKLKINDDNNEFMLIGTKQQLSKVNIDCLTVGSIDVAPITVARNLGTWFDSNLNPQEQIHKTCKSGFFHLYNIHISESICFRNLLALWSID